MRTLPLLVHADSIRIPLPDNSVHLVATSPPYYNMRVYGVAPTVWGGDLDCDHDWGWKSTAHVRGKVGDPLVPWGRLGRSGRGPGAADGSRLLLQEVLSLARLPGAGAAP